MCLSCLLLHLLATLLIKMHTSKWSSMDALVDVDNNLSIGHWSDSVSLNLLVMPETTYGVDCYVVSLWQRYSDGRVVLDVIFQKAIYWWHWSCDRQLVLLIIRNPVFVPFATSPSGKCIDRLHMNFSRPTDCYVNSSIDLMVFVFSKIRQNDVYPTVSSFFLEKLLWWLVIYYFIIMNLRFW